MRPSLRPAALAALILLGAGTLAQQAFADAPTPDTPPAPMSSATTPPPPPAGADAGPGGVSLAEPELRFISFRTGRRALAEVSCGQRGPWPPSPCKISIS